MHELGEITEGVQERTLLTPRAAQVRRWSPWTRGGCSLMLVLQLHGEQLARAVGFREHGAVGNIHRAF